MTFLRTGGDIKELLFIMKGVADIMVGLKYIKANSEAFIIKEIMRYLGHAKRL